MTRPDRYKLGYVFAVLATAGLAVIPVLSVQGVQRIGALLVVGALLLLPGRLQAWLLRDHFLGRRAQQKGRPQEALLRYEAQLARWAERPWLRHAVWLGWMVYTPDGEAMVWNNIAAAHLDQRHRAPAREAAQKALAIDPLYPLPWLNLAIAALLENDRDEAARCVAEARRLGYRGTTVDRLIRVTSAAWGQAQAATLTKDD